MPVAGNRQAEGTVAGADADWSAGLFSYDGAGNVWKQDADSPLKPTSDTYVYDKVSRLKEWKVGTATQETFTYDAFGNLTNYNGRTLTAGSSNRLSNAGYDAAGNMTGWGYHAGPPVTYDLNFGFNPQGQLASVSGSGVDRTIAYNAEGERVVVRDGTRYRLTLRGLDSNVLREMLYDGSTWTWRKDYIYRDGVLLASQGGENPDVSPVRAEGIRHYSLDHLGSPRLVTNRCGEKFTLFATDPFGIEATGGDQVSGERHRYTIHERDLGSLTSSIDDLDAMPARTYQPYLARFLSVDPYRGDPSEPQSFNGYGYVTGGPMTFIDPFGLNKAAFDETWTCDEKGCMVCTADGCHYNGSAFMTVVGSSFPVGYIPHSMLVWYFMHAYYGNYIGSTPIERGSGGGLTRGQQYALACELADSMGDESCTWFCAKEALGLQTVAGVGLPVLGAEVIPKDRLLQGTTERTSVLSRYLGRWFPQRVPSTWTPIPGHWLARSPVAGRIAARWLPYLGWGLLAGDAAAFVGCLTTCTGTL